MRGLAVSAAVIVGGLAISGPSSGRDDAASGQLAFLRSTPSASSDWHIFVVNRDGRGERQLTQGPGTDFALSWSPDGRRLAFTHWIIGQKTAGARHVYEVNADGSGLRRLTGRDASTVPSYSEDQAAWSPDGRTVAYSSSGTIEGKHRYGIYLIGSEGGPARRLDRLPWYNRPLSPAWSPDGRQIAFASGGGVIFVINADGTGQRRLSHPHHFSGWGFYAPSWSPDGRRIAYVTMPGGYDSIYVIDVDGRHERLVTSHAYTEGGVLWRPDGSGIVYARASRGGIYSINLDGSGDHRLNPTAPRRDLLGTLSLSSDRRTIAFGSDSTGQGDIYVMNRGGGSLRRLTDTEDLDGAPLWAP